MKSMKRRVTRQEWKLRLRVARQIIGENQVSASVHENQLGPEDCAVSLLRDGENSLPVADGETSLCTDQFDCTDFSDYSSFPTEESARDAIGNALTRVSESEESSTLENNLAEANSQDSEISEEDTYNDSMCLSDLSDYCTTSDDEITELSTTDHEPSTTPLQCLYPGSNVSKNDFNVAMLSISHKHSLTNSCLVDILNLFSEVLPMGTQTSSRHMLMRSFVDYNEEITVHRCCGYCSRLLSDLSCDLPECQAAEVSDSSFIQICLVKQLQTLFSDVKFLQLLKYRFERASKCHIGDIYDGLIYKEQSDFFGSPYNLSFTLNYDGAPKFKSSNMQIWPIQLSINELPPRLRRSKNYMILAGLWCANQKPPSFTFLEPVLTSIKDLDENGFEMPIAGLGHHVVRARLICAVMDLPAKALVLNCNQYNGAFGCSVCKHPGEMVSVGKGKSRSYPHQQVIELRSHVEHLRDAQSALSSSKVVYGVKGFSALHLLSHFDVIRSIPVDYMHCVLLGVTKKLAVLWFKSSNHTEDWYIGKKIKEVDARLLQIRLPDCIERTPRSITQRKFWKASEWKSFLFFYIPATLNGILPGQFYIHAFLLVKSIRILLSCDISEADLKLSEKMLNTFCSQMESLYGISKCGINFHSLLHLPYFVRLLGPLWTHSAFSFENQMQNFLHHSHATRSIGKQIAESFLLNQKLHIERRKSLCSSSCPDGLQSLLRTFQVNAPGNEIEMVGSGTSYSLQDTEASRVNQILSSNGHSCLRSTCVRMYHKATVNGKVFFSKGYKRVTKRNSYTIMYLNLSMGTVQYGIIEKFIYADGHYLASIQEIMIVSKGPPQEFSESITANSRKLLFSDYSTFKYGDSNYIFVSQILEKCCNLSNGDWNVLTLPVNDVEVE